MTDLFGLEQQQRLTGDRPKSIALENSKARELRKSTQSSHETYFFAN